MSDDLIGWLRKQLGEDELMALGVHLEVCSSVVRTVRNGVVWAVGGCDCGVPARVLREVEAKRRFIDSVTAAESPLTTRTAEFAVVRMVLRLMTLPYSNRPGCREEWRA